MYACMFSICISDVSFLSFLSLCLFFSFYPDSLFFFSPEIITIYFMLLSVFLGHLCVCVCLFWCLAESRWSLLIWDNLLFWAKSKDKFQGKASSVRRDSESNCIIWLGTDTTRDLHLLPPCALVYIGGLSTFVVVVVWVDCDRCPWLQTDTGLPRKGLRHSDTERALLPPIKIKSDKG